MNAKCACGPVGILEHRLVQLMRVRLNNTLKTNLMQPDLSKYGMNLSQKIQSLSRIYPNSLDGFSLNGRLRPKQTTGL